MALDVNCFNCVGFVCSASRKEAPAGTSLFPLSDQKCKLGQAEQDPIFARKILRWTYICPDDIIFSATDDGVSAV